MTNEEKQLLFKDLCARLPYGVICKVVANDNPWIGDCKLRSYWLDRVTDICFEIKPYLRSLSNMTEEEKLSYETFFNYDGIEYPEEYIDWHLEHHFDFRGLIERGLALEAPEDMYKTK